VLVLAAAIVAIVAVAASLAVATLRGLEAFRAAKRLQQGLGAELANIDRSVGEIDGHLQRFEQESRSLQAALRTLRRDRATLAVLTAALDDVKFALGRVTAVYPRK
jgi:hypothetical protein